MHSFFFQEEKKAGIILSSVCGKGMKQIMNRQIVKEHTSYWTLLYRKKRWMRMMESFAFVLGLLVILMFFPFRSQPFIFSVIGLAMVVFFGFPCLYRCWLRPHYKLYPDRLEIRMRSRTETIPLQEMTKDFDLPYGYVIRGKREYLLVSNHFLEKLNGQLEVIKYG
ncbi:hypothetical protein [Thermoactinomyces sp. AS95]|jgi:hypothetical protein|uniref:hypothetical protein n=1 Tax=Thermoactinomyces sp. AS95 TaxID=1811386 RepID=UPI000A868ED0|nr:hypothetical protein [Thermoactinomyces sp. AS95]